MQLTVHENKLFKPVANGQRWGNIIKCNKMNEKRKSSANIYKINENDHKPACQFNWASFRHNNIAWRIFSNKIGRYHYVQVTNLCEQYTCTEVSK